jgi:hypothetical protein
MKPLLPVFPVLDVLAPRGTGGGDERRMGGGVLRLLKERPPILDLASALSTTAVMAKAESPKTASKTNVKTLFICQLLTVWNDYALVKNRLLC